MMPMFLTGDMSRHAQSLRNGSALRAQLDRLTAEMTSGLARDATAHLGGRGDRLVQTDRQIALRAAEQAATLALGQRLETAQVALGAVSDLGNDLSAALVALPPAAGDGELGTAAARSEAAFRSAVSALNTRHGPEALFAGTATDGTALASADTILAALRNAAAGAGSAADLAARVDAFFADPGGGFYTLAYQGDTGPAATRRIGADQQISTGPRADDPVLRTMLRGMALGALVTDPGVSLSTTDRAAVARQAGVDLLGATAPLTEARAALGAAQDQVEETAARQSARLVAARLMRNDLVALDPSDTATRLTQVQTQLETHYTVTARLSGLTLAGYLR